MWKKDRTELLKQRDRLKHLQSRVTMELYGVDLALQTRPLTNQSQALQWTEASESSPTSLSLHVQPRNCRSQWTRMMSLGLTPHYCCRKKYTGQRLTYQS